MPRRKRKAEDAEPLGEGTSSYRLNLTNANAHFGYFEGLSRFSTGQSSYTTLETPFEPDEPLQFHVLLQQMVTAISVEDAIFYMAQAEASVVYDVVRAFDYLCASEELTKAVHKWCLGQKRPFTAALLFEPSGRMHKQEVSSYVHSLEIVRQVCGKNSTHKVDEWMYRTLPPDTMPPMLELYRRVAHVAHLDRLGNLCPAGGAVLRCFLPDYGASCEDAWSGSDVDYFVDVQNFSPEDLHEYVMTPVEWVARTGKSTMQLKVRDDPHIHNIIYVKDVTTTVLNYFDLDCVKAVRECDGTLRVSLQFLRCLVNRTCMADDTTNKLPMRLRGLARAHKYAARGFAAPPAWPTLDEPWQPRQVAIPRIRFKSMKDDTPLQPIETDDFAVFAYSDRLKDNPPILSRTTFTCAPVVEDPSGKDYECGPEYFFRRVKVEPRPTAGVYAPHANLHIEDETKQQLLKAISETRVCGRDMSYLCDTVKSGTLDLLDPSKTGFRPDTECDIYATPLFKKEHAMPYLVISWLRIA